MGEGRGRREISATVARVERSESRGCRSRISLTLNPGYGLHRPLSVQLRGRERENFDGGGPAVERDLTERLHRHTAVQCTLRRVMMA